MPDPIKITPDELNSPRVDKKLQEQSAASRAGEHYDRLAGESASMAWSSLLYNSLFYMTLFGLLGGFVAWGVGEVMFLTIGSSEEIQVFYHEYNKINDLQISGEITKQEADTQRANLYYAYNHLKIANMLNDGASQEEIDRLEARESVRRGISSFLYFPVIAITLAFFVSISEQAVSQNLRGIIINGSVGIILGLVSGVVGIFMLIVLSQILPDSMREGTENGPSVGFIIFRTIGWTVIGGMMSLGPGVVMKNWKRFLIGLAGGLIGGAIGGLLFDIIGLATDFTTAMPSRFVGLVSIGLVAGLGTGLIESVAKKGWMRVTAGLIAGKQFILYKNPTYIGSSPNCEIYLFKDPSISPRHAAIRQTPAGYFIEDINSSTGTRVNGQPITKTRLNHNDQVQIAATVFVFQEKARS